MAPLAHVPSPASPGGLVQSILHLPRFWGMGRPIPRNQSSQPQDPPSSDLQLRKPAAKDLQHQAQDPPPTSWPRGALQSKLRSLGSVTPSVKYQRRAVPPNIPIPTKIGSPSKARLQIPQKLCHRAHQQRIRLRKHGNSSEHTCQSTRIQTPLLQPS